MTEGLHMCYFSPHAPILELLDFCANGEGADGSETFLNIERWLFEGNRARLLHTVKRMQAEGTLAVLRGDALVARSELDAWLRGPASEETAHALAVVTLRTTEAGLKWV